MRPPKYLFPESNTIDNLPDSRVGLWIALAACLSLFLELMIIRFHSTSFHLFTYFKNVSLLSCFLGLGIGYSRGSKSPFLLTLALPLLGLQIILIQLLRHAIPEMNLLNPISEQLTMGILQADDVLKTVFAYLFLALVYFVNALCFIPFGQLVSRLMLRKQGLASYGWNLAGSVCGIVIFSVLSFMWTPPSVWLIFATLLLAAFFYKDLINFLLSILVCIVALLFLTSPPPPGQLNIYSPYQILTLAHFGGYPPTLLTGNAYYQKILNLSKDEIKKDPALKVWSGHYELPYFFKPEPENVLIVGSGAGNDVAAALRRGARQIDAVEIDPAILSIGKKYHPESPYQAGNVHAVVDDARTFIRHTDKRYDLIVYGLLDSHVLLSGRGGIRLDSYVYTTEAFREARKKLKEGGVICLTFAVLSQELGRKLFLMLQEAFDGSRPIVYRTAYDGGVAFLCGDKLAAAPLRSLSGFEEVTRVFADKKLRADKATDDWPFFYMPVRKYPLTYVAMVLILLALSGLFVYKSVPDLRGGFSAPCFFLGAGFMLLETKAITELALVYGSTWMVISAVITGILIMSFLANFLVMKRGEPGSIITYGLLSFSLIAGFGMTFLDLSVFPSWLSRIMATALLTLPLFFSGLAFSSELKKGVTASIAISSNLLGAMLGGFLEYNSMYFGYRALYLIALVAYGCAFLVSVRPSGLK